MHAFKIILVNLSVFLVLGGALEVGSRFLYPEFVGHIHSPTRTLGLYHHTGVFRGVSVRAPYPDYEYPIDRPFLVVLGDSISNGYGSAFEDIYWVKLQRLLDLNPNTGLRVVSLSGYGDNLNNSVEAVAMLSSDKALRISGILYQFNLNDVTPYGRAELKRLSNEGLVHGDAFKKLAGWRYEYLNSSVFIRVASHYAGVFARRLSGTCEERGLDALGPYTWSFGSRKYREESEKHWGEFEAKLAKLNRVTDQIGAQLWIFVSPLVFDVDTHGLHPHYNPVKLDFSCATINPRERLNLIASRLNISVIDPASYLKASFERRVKENNFVPYFFAADENHFTPVAASYIAEYLFEHLSRAHMNENKMGVSN